MKSILLSRLYTCSKSFLALVVLFPALLLNSACTTLGFQSQTPVEIHYSSPDRISFQGKGAGAGMALMSSMGPIGIAIGVAIDEGIAKDIRETAVEAGVSFKTLLRDSVSDIEALNLADRIEVKRYGFVIKLNKTITIRRLWYLYKSKC